MGVEVAVRVITWGLVDSLHVRSQHFRHIVPEARLNIFSCDVVLRIIAIIILKSLVVVIWCLVHILLSINI